MIDQAIWAIGNIAADQTLYRDKILKQGGLNYLITIVENSQSKSIIRNGVWAMTNLCRGSPPPNYELIKNSTEIFGRVLQSGIITNK